MADRDGGGSRGRMTTFVWNPADHATYCPQHWPPPADGGGSSWLCCCTGGEKVPRVSGAEKDTA